MFSKAYKCDLHIHTDFSNKTKDHDYVGHFSLEKLVEKLNLPENDIKMFSLTDHNIFNVEVYKEYFKSYNENERKLFIGVELDILKEEDLFNEIYNLKNGNSKKVSKYHALIIFKNNDIDGLEEKLERMYKCIEIEYQKEYSESINFSLENIKIRRTSIDRIITSFYGEDYLIVAHGKKDSSIVSAYKQNITDAQKMILLGIINSLEMSPNKFEAVEHYKQGFDKVLKDEFRSRSDVPYVVFSDNHEINAYPNYKSDQIINDRPFTWIKGDLSFETLRLAFIDPLSRIAISNTVVPFPLKYLESISYKIVDSNDIVQDRTIDFSSGINVIIGGRSSGKSLLLNAILYNLSTSRDLSKISDYENVKNKIIIKDSILGKLNVESDYKSLNSCNTKAFSQDEIVNKFNDNGEALTDALPFERFNEEEIKDELNLSFSILDSLSRNYRLLSTHKNYRDLQFLSEDIISSSKNKKLSFLYEAGIDAVEDSIIESSMSIRNIINKLIESKDNLRNLSSIKYGLNLLFDSEDIMKFESVVSILESKILNFENKYYESKVKEVFINKVRQKVPEIFKTWLSNHDMQIEDAEIRLNNQLTKSKNYFKSLILFESSINKIDDLKFDLKSKDFSYSNEFKLRTEINYELNKDIFQKHLIDKISNFDENNIRKSLMDMIFDQNGVKIKRKTNSPNDFDDLINSYKTKVKDSVKPKYTIVEKNLEKDISSEFMSPGKKASIYLDIIIDNLYTLSDPFILIVDQPEDNLDNMFITDRLIEKFRMLRGKVQVILVTHNAPIAINCDSDNIIIATNNNKVIDYRYGGLENLEFRKEICKILDGGHYIFDRRYHKYDIPKRKIYEPITTEDE